VMLVSFLFGVIDGIKASALADLMPAWTSHLPLAAQGLAWLPPSLVMLVLVGIYDKISGPRSVTAHQ